MTSVWMCLLSPSVCRHLSNWKRMKPTLLTVQMSLPINVQSYVCLLCSYDNDIVNFCSLTSNDNPWHKFFFPDSLIGAVLTKLLLSGGNMEVHWSSRNWHVLVWHYIVKVQRCLIIGANRSSKTQTLPTFYSSCLNFYLIKISH